MTRAPSKYQGDVPRDIAATPGTPLLPLPRGVRGGIGVLGVGRATLRTGWYNRSADRSFHMRANVCDPTKTIVKHSLKTLNCSVVFRGSAKGSQQAGVLIIEYIRSKDEQ